MKQRLTLISLAIILSTASLLSQDSSADFMRETGKIYVVVAVLASILICLLLFLAYIDKRVRKLERTLNDEHDHESR